jgi:hypothetical protein
MPDNKFKNHALGKTEPAIDAFTITPDDVTEFDEQARAIYVGGDGNISVQTPSNNAVIFTGVKAGSILPVAAIRVNAVGTSATGLIGLV